MRKIALLVAVTTVALAVALLLTAPWGGGGAGTSLVAVDARTGNELWRVASPVASAALSSVADHQLFLQGGDSCSGHYGTFVALEATSGVQQWRTPTYNARNDGCYTSIWGAAAARGIAVVRDEQGIQGLDSTTGQQLWTIAAAKDLDVNLVGAEDVVLDVPHPWGAQHDVRAFDRRTGEQRWTKGLPVDDSCGVMFPVVSGATAFFPVLVGTSQPGYVDASITAIDLITGTERWRVDMGRISQDIHACVFAGDGVVVTNFQKEPTCRPIGATSAACGPEGKGPVITIVALASDDGRELWRREGGNRVGAFVGDSVYVFGRENAASSTIEALEAKSGVRRWEATWDKPIDYPPLTDGQFILLTSLGRGVTDRGATSAVFDAATGAHLWDRPLPPLITLADGVLYFVISGEFAPPPAN